MCSMISRSVMPRVVSRIASTSATKACRLAPPLPASAPTLCARLRPLARAASCSCSRVRAPMPRVGKVHHPQKAGVVVRVLDQAQVAQRVFHLGALEEAQAAVDLVRDAGVEQPALDHPALRVAAVEHGDVAPRGAFAVQLAAPRRLSHCGLGEVAGGLEHPHRLALARPRCAGSCPGGASCARSAHWRCRGCGRRSGSCARA